MRTTTDGEICHHCGKRGAWSSLGPDAVYTPPPGHTVRRLAGFEGISYDTCPVMDELTIYPPDGPLAL